MGVRHSPVLGVSRPSSRVSMDLWPSQTLESYRLTSSKEGPVGERRSQGDGVGGPVGKDGVGTGETRSQGVHERSR